ncbi:MAG TPA: translocation/assembly module TamB domain-containing protein, partial [Terriglobales bacterium]|nr:translocation/assembly module TamB domain-containing protein [Terriglobales bacterium]
NWQNGPSSKTGKRREAALQKGSVRLKFRNASVAEAADIISSRDFPLSSLNLAGSADGSLEAGWMGAISNLETSVALDVSPPDRPGAGQLPVTAHGRIAYRNARQELEADLAASTRATQVHASGELSAGSVMKLSVSTTNLNEWQPGLLAFHATLPFPTTLKGRAVFLGTASGRVSDITLAGNLQAEDFDVVVPATARTLERQAHWDSLSAAIQLSSRLFSAHNGSLRQGDTAISFDFSAGLTHGSLTAASALSARLSIQQSDAASVLALAGLNYPVAGKLNLHLTVSGTKASLAGDGHFELTDATLYGRPVQRLESDVHRSGEEARLSNFLARFYDSQVTGSASYNLSSGAIRLDAKGNNLDLGRLPQLRSSRFEVAGRADFAAIVTGTGAAPSLTANVHLRELTVSNQRLGDFTLNAATQGESVHITGQSQFQQADLALDGMVRLRGEWPCDINVRFKQFDVSPLLQAHWSARVTRSLVSGQVRVEGPLLRPSELKLTGTLDDLSTGVQEIELHNDGPIKFTISNQLLQIEPFHLTGERTDLTGSGTVHLAGNRELDLRAHGRANLRLIENFNHDFNPSGVVTVDLTVVGTVASPIAQGRLQIANGSLAYLDLPSGLSEMNGALVFNQGRVQIESLTARTGGGTVTLGGFATLQNGRVGFDLTAHGEGVRLRYPPGISSTADADLRFAGSSDSATLSGNITVTKLSVTPGFDFGAYLARSAQSGSLSENSPLLNRIRLDVHIATTPELQMQTTQLRLSGDADLRLRGTAAKPALLGRAEVIEGDVYFNGTKYHLERGDVNFIPPGIRPVFDLQMSTRVRDYDVTVGLNGPLNKLNLTYRSEPPLPEADIVALLALGRTREESAQLQQTSQSPFNQEASSAILSEALNAVVSNRVQRLFGGSRIKIDPQGLYTETNPSRGPQVTIEQQVTHDLTLTYSTAVSQSSEQIIQVEYNLTHNVSIVALRDQNGVVSFDVRIRQRRK